MRGYLFISLLAVVCLSGSIFNRHLLQNAAAVCLDGSPGAYYISEGTGDNRNKVVLYFDGGGWCGGSDLANTLENCYQRSLTDLGSSKNYPPTMDFTTGGVLSGQNALNPQFYDWTRVFFRYCDGSGHQGFKNASVSYKGADLFFRGENITMERFRALNITHRLFTQVEDIVVTGNSAGGLAAFHWGEYVKRQAQGKVWTVADSGIFLDSINVKTGQYAYREKLINLMKLSNAEVDPPVSGCIKQYPTEKWRCMFAQYMYPYLQVPLFSVNSLYDTWSIANILGITCIDSFGSLKNCLDSDRHIIEDYKKNSTDVLTQIAAINGNGAWGIACAGHSYLYYNAMNSPNFRVPGGSDNTIEFSVAAWIIGFKQNTHIDTVSWPNNKECAGETVNTSLTVM